LLSIPRQVSPLPAFALPLPDPPEPSVAFELFPEDGQFSADTDSTFH
jgi:hypothetical protein